MEKSYKIKQNGKVLGSVVLGISQDSVDNLIAESDGRIEKDVAKVQQTGEDVIRQFIVVIVIGVCVVSAV